MTLVICPLPRGSAAPWWQLAGGDHYDGSKEAWSGKPVWPHFAPHLTTEKHQKNFSVKDIKHYSREVEYIFLFPKPIEQILRHNTENVQLQIKDTTRPTPLQDPKKVKSTLVTLFK